MSAKTLSRGKIIQFFSSDIAKGLFTGMIANYLLYIYQPTVDSGLPNLLPDNKIFGFLTIMAVLMGLSKVVDAITDPIIASFSDKCKSPYGRRMPFMRVAAVPYAICAMLIFITPFSAGSVWNAVWVGVFLILYYVFYTLYFIPQRALVPEIIPDPKSRVSYYAVSTVFYMGSSAVMYATTLFVSWFMKAGLTKLDSWRAVFGIFAVISLVFLLLGAFAFREKDYTGDSHIPTDSIFKSFKIVIKNKNFVIFTIGDLFSYISLAFFETAMMYYITVLINVPEEQSFFVMLAAIVTAIVLFPFILFISRKYNKKVPLIVASFMFTVLFILIYFGNDIAALVPGHELAIGIVMGILVAYPFAAVNILPQAVVSDIIQEDSLRSGSNREGFYSASKTFIEKIGYAVAMAVVSSVLLIGAVDGGKVGMEGIKLTGICAGVFSLLSAVFYMFYNDKYVSKYIAEHRKTGSENSQASNDASLSGDAASNDFGTGENASNNNACSSQESALKNESEFLQSVSGAFGEPEAVDYGDSETEWPSDLK